MLKLEFDLNNKAAAAALGRALLEIAGDSVVASTTVKSLTDTVADAATLSDEPALSNAADATPSAASNAELDEKGVAFNPDFCGRAKEPFYGSGKTKGQWKKRVGVTQDDYDAWYAGELFGNGESDDSDEVEIDTSAAFGATANNSTPAATVTGAGQLMGWIAEMQAAGRLQQADVNAAYVMTGVQVQDLFQPATEAASVAKVYGVLAAKVG